MKENCVVLDSSWRQILVHEGGHTHTDRLTLQIGSFSSSKWNIECWLWRTLVFTRPPGHVYYFRIGQARQPYSRYSSERVWYTSISTGNRGQNKREIHSCVVAFCTAERNVVSSVAKSWPIGWVCLHLKIVYCWDDLVIYCSKHFSNAFLVSKLNIYLTIFF